MIAASIAVVIATGHYEETERTQHYAEIRMGYKLKDPNYRGDAIYFHKLIINEV